MEETLFYILGFSVVALALLVSFVGLKFENFPPKPFLVLGTALFAGLVIATAAFAWINGEEEQEHRNELIASGEELSPQQGLEELGEGTGAAAPGAVAPEEGGAESTGEDPAGDDAAGETASVDGAQVFTDAGCGGCHILAAAGSTSTTGPDLDASLKGQSEEFIETAIVDPNAEVGEDYPPNVMPQTYEEQLSPEELDALVAYLSESTSG